MDSLKEQYRDYISKRDYTYFDKYTAEDQQLVIDEAKHQLQSANIKQISSTHGSRPEFLAIVSHELRTPLNGLIGIIDLMQSEQMTEDQRLYIKTLEESCSRLLSLVNRLQDLAALQATRPAINIMPFDLVAIITGVAESMQHFSTHTGRGTQVTLDLDPRLPLSVNGDLTKIQQVLNNLVTIAATASSEKHASLKATLESSEGPNAVIHILIRGAKAEMSTTLLEGFGLTFSYEDILRPLTAENMSQGIVISREFLSLLGSTLSITTGPDDALTFSFHLHLTCNPKNWKDHDSQSNYGEIKADLSNVHILIVEDNIVNQQIAKKMLKKLGIIADVADNGRKALKCLAEKKYDIIFMVTTICFAATSTCSLTWRQHLYQDCDMPVMDGYDCTSYIRTTLNDHDIKIIALTANSTNDAKKRCISVGMNDFFTKPITLKTLSEMLHKWLPTTVNLGEKGNTRL
ncbi:CheY-like superfamily [Gaertneriomyces semiglobifer]|nr:CheY-like superfamily [Gaertneriomyces semiglobifer]